MHPTQQGRIKILFGTPEHQAAFTPYLSQANSQTVGPQKALKSDEQTLGNMDQLSSSKCWRLHLAQLRMAQLRKLPLALAKKAASPRMGGSPIPTKPFAKPAIKRRPQRTLQDNARCGLASSDFAYKGYFARSVTLQSLISTELNIPADENGSLATNFSTAARSGAATTKNVPAE